MYYTYDEWENTVLHIQTGESGMKMFKELGFVSMPEEEYEKHMASFRRIKEKENELFNKWLEDFLEWCKK